MDHDDAGRAVRSPNRRSPYIERLIGTLRRDCLDHVLIFGERHLRRVLTSYSVYYNETRTHLGLGKDAPLGRAVERSGTVVAIPVLCGLHRIATRGYNFRVGQAETQKWKQRQQQATRIVSKLLHIGPLSLVI